MHLTRGTYYLGVIVKWYDIQRTFDFKFPATTLFVNSDEVVLGGATLYPEFELNSKSSKNIAL